MWIVNVSLPFFFHPLSSLFSFSYSETWHTIRITHVLLLKFTLPSSLTHPNSLSPFLFFLSPSVITIFFFLILKPFHSSPFLTLPFHFLIFSVTTNSTLIASFFVKMKATYLGFFWYVWESKTEAFADSSPQIMLHIFHGFLCGNKFPI